MLIQFLLIWLLLSVRFSVSSSICLRKSLMSSSHLFLGLPIDLLVLYFELSSGFHPAAFNNHLSFGDVGNSHRQSPFHSSSSHIPASYLLIFHLFHSFIGAPFIFMYSTQSSPSISAASISSSLSISNDTSLSWSL